MQTFSKECEYIRYSYFLTVECCISNNFNCLEARHINYSYCRDVVTNGNAIKHEGTNESDPAVEVICLFLYIFCF